MTDAEWKDLSYEKWAKEREETIRRATDPTVSHRFTTCIAWPPAPPSPEEFARVLYGRGRADGYQQCKEVVNARNLAIQQAEALIARYNIRPHEIWGRAASYEEGED